MKKIAIVLLLTVIALMFTVSAAAQATQVKGRCSDEAGKPIVDGTVIYENLESGRKFTMHTDKRGEYISLGAAPGRYKVTLQNSAGQTLFFFASVNIGMDVDKNVVDFDLKKERAGNAATLTDDQKKKVEAAQKENAKIGNLNQMLRQASDFRAANQCDDAVQLMTQATTIDATKHQLWNSLAESDSCAKKYPEAVEAYKKAIELMPTSGDYYNNMGNVLVKAGKNDEAVASFEKAAEVEPAKAGTYYFNEGAIMYNKGQMEDAAKAFDKAIQIDPTKADAYYLKGSAQIAKATLGADNKMVAPAGTKEAFDKYLELAPTGSHAAEAKAMLEALGAKVETTYGTQKKKSK